MSAIKCKAAVLWAPNTPFDVTEVQLQPPRRGEVRVKVLSNSLCHTDLYTLEGCDSEGKFPCILGHEATAVVESVGEGVVSLVPGDLVIPCYTPECRESECIFCNSNKTNLCPKIRATQGQGLMPDGTSRFSKDGKVIYHFMGCSTFAQFTVIAEISAAKINPGMPQELGSLIGCGVSTGWGAVVNNCKVGSKNSVVVFGLGAVGLSVIQMAKYVGANPIIGVDLNPKKFKAALAIGATHCILSDEALKENLLKEHKWGYDFTFDCTGNTNVMRMALEVAHRGWGQSCVIGVAQAGKELATRPFQLVTGRVWKGTAFGGWKSRTDVPKLVNRSLLGDLDLSPYITHRIESLQKVNDSVAALKSGECLRAVVNICKAPTPAPAPKIVSKNRTGSGWLLRVRHQSTVLDCAMHFHIYLPGEWMDRQAPYPVLYFLSGLTCTDQNAPTKSNFQSAVGDLRMAIVFPDTSPRPDPCPQEVKQGLSSGFYINATSPAFKQFQMYSYIKDQLPQLVQQYFPVDPKRKAISGHSMGGHGALLLHLRNPGLYSSVSAFAPICSASTSQFGKDLYSKMLAKQEEGQEWDCQSHLERHVKAGTELGQILIDVGSADCYEDDLSIAKFQTLLREAKAEARVNVRRDFGHSYYFVSSFLGEHLRFHGRALGCE